MKIYRDGIQNSWLNNRNLRAINYVGIHLPMQCEVGGSTVREAVTTLLSAKVVSAEQRIFTSVFRLLVGIPPNTRVCRLPTVIDFLSSISQ